MIGDGTRDGDPAFVSQRSDNESACRSEVLVPVLHLCIYLPDYSVFSVFDRILELLLPGKVINRLSLISYQVGNNVSVMDISRNEGNCNFVVNRVFKSALD